MPLPGMILGLLFFVGSLALSALQNVVGAQAESPDRSVLVYVTPTSEHVNLSASEHLLIFRLPVQVPGASLPPGRYIFRLVTPSVLQVVDATHFRVYSTFFVLSTPGEGDSGRERIRLSQNLEDDVPRIVGWYLPGGIGYEFQYRTPKHQVPQRGQER
jgi:hypothetical protein